MIMGHTCTVRGVYEPPQQDCGPSYTIKESFLEYVLTVTKITRDHDYPHIGFEYVSGSYEDGKKQSDCNSIGEDDSGEQVKACKFGFPVKGKSG